MILGLGLHPNGDLGLSFKLALLNVGAGDLSA